MSEAQIEHLRYLYSLPGIKLGEGTFGMVTLHMEKSGRKYVIKEVRIRDPLEFQNEANILYELSENPETAPFVSKTKYSLIYNGFGYIVQDYEDTIEGFTFYESKNMLSEEVGIELINNLIKALEAIHRAGYIHRDLKLENTLFRIKDGKIYPIPIIIDFGSACKIPCGSKSLVGTASYLPSNYLSPSNRYNPSVRLFYHGTNKKRTLRLKNTGTVLRRNYSKKSDNYALGILIGILVNERIMWVNKDKQIDYSIKAHELMKEIIPNLAANMGQRFEYNRTLKRERVVAAAPAAAASASASASARNTRKRKRNNSSAKNNSRQPLPLKIFRQTTYI